jgi:hypothetical protein
LEKGKSLCQYAPIEPREEPTTKIENDLSIPNQDEINHLLL